MALARQHGNTQKCWQQRSGSLWNFIEKRAPYFGTTAQVVSPSLCHELHMHIVPLPWYMVHFAIHPRLYLYEYLYNYIRISVSACVCVCVCVSGGIVACLCGSILWRHLLPLAGPCRNLITSITIRGGDSKIYAKNKRALVLAIHSILFTLMIRAIETMYTRICMSILYAYNF